MPGALQCFECWIWSEIGAKCVKHGTPKDETKRKAAADAGVQQLMRSKRSN